MEESRELVSLEGTPRAVGAAFGRANAADIAEGVERFYATVAEAEGIAPADLARAGRHYLSLVARYAPHWLEEAEALAGAAGVDAERYLIYQGAKYRGINRPECFSYTSAPAMNAGGVTLLHKNRDNVARPQCAYVKGAEVTGRPVYRFAANADTSDMGAMMALNERGLAVVADMGVPDPHPRQRGMMNPEILRLLVERSADVDEALELLREFHRERVYAGGKIATNWLLADRHGRGLRVYQSHEELVVKRAETGGFLVMRDADPRGDLVAGEFRRSAGRLTSGVFNRLSRQAPVLVSSNVSAYTAVIPAERPDLFAYATFAVANAGQVLYVPLYLGASAVPRSLLDGTLFRLAMAHPFGADLFARCRERGVDLDQFESDMEADRANLDAAARQALTREGEAQARLLLTQGCLRFTRRAEQMLRVLGGGVTSNQ